MAINYKIESVKAFTKYKSIFVLATNDTLYKRIELPKVPINDNPDTYLASLSQAELLELWQGGIEVTAQAYNRLSELPYEMVFNQLLRAYVKLETDTVNSVLGDMNAILNTVPAIKTRFEAIVGKDARLTLSPSTAAQRLDLINTAVRLATVGLAIIEDNKS